MLGQDRADQPGQQGDVTDIHVRMADRLDNQPCRDAINPGAAKRLRQFRRNKAKVAHFADQVAIQRTAGIALNIARHQSLSAETLGNVLNGTLLIGEVEIHGRFQTTDWHVFRSSDPAGPLPHPGRGQSSP